MTHLLRRAKGNDAVLGITDKFSKAVRLISGKSTWTAAEWADAAFDTIFVARELPQTILPDQGPRFMLEFWQATI